MNQIVKEECPYCEHYVLAQMRDSFARKATRWFTKKGITSTVEYAGNAVTGFGGTLLAEGLKIFFGDTLEEAGNKAESSMFETGEFDFSCPHCGRTWYRQIPHSQGDITIQIDHKFVKKERRAYIWKKFGDFLGILFLAALVALFTYFVVYLWADEQTSTHSVYSEGLLGLGSGYHQETNFLYYIAWFVLGICALFCICLFLFVIIKFIEWLEAIFEDKREFRFRLLTTSKEKEE